MKDILKNIKNIELAFIFGSFAKEEEDTYSDIDLMIIGNPNEDELVSAISKIEVKLNREVNYHIYTFSDINKKVQKGNTFINNVLSEPKIFLIGNKNELSRFN